MNYITIPGALAPLLGPSVGGFIVTYFSWPWIFFINLPIGIMGVVLVYIHIPEITEQEVAPLDLLGFLLSGIGLASLVLGFEAMGRGLLPTPAVVALLCGGAACAVLYVLHAVRIPNPIIDLKLLRIKTFAASLSGGCLFFISTTSVVFLMALLLQVGFGFTAFQAGLTTLAGAAGSLITRFAFRPVLRLTGFRQLLIFNAGVSGLYLLASGLFRVTTPYAVILIVLFIGGLSRSMQFTAVQSLSYADMPPSQMSRATSFFAMSQQLAQSFGVGLAALVIHLTLTWHGDTTLTASDIAPGFFTIGIATMASIFVFLLLPVHAGATLGSGSQPRSGRA
jgi:MFS family permease